MPADQWWLGLESYHGQEVTCNDAIGTFHYAVDDALPTKQVWKISVGGQLLSGHNFEVHSACKSKNPKKSIRFKETGLTLDETAAPHKVQPVSIPAKKRVPTPNPRSEPKKKPEPKFRPEPAVQRSKKRPRGDDPSADGTRSAKKGRDANPFGKLKDDDKMFGVCIDSTEKPSQITMDKLRRTTATCEKGYRTARATHSVTSGQWCFEITVNEPKEIKQRGSSTVSPHIRVGWCSSKFKLEAPVGFDRHGFSYRDFSRSVPDGVEGGGSVFHRARGRAYGEGYGAGDTISCYLCLPSHSTDELQETSAAQIHPRGPSAASEPNQQGLTREESQLEMHKGSYIEFCKNGVSLGKAFVDIPKGNYYPCCALYMGASATFNFGDPYDGNLKYPAPDGFRRIAEVAPVRMPDPVEPVAAQAVSEPAAAQAVSEPAAEVVAPAEEVAAASAEEVAAAQEPVVQETVEPTEAAAPEPMEVDAAI